MVIRFKRLAPGFLAVSGTNFTVWHDKINKEWDLWLGEPSNLGSTYMFSRKTKDEMISAIKAITEELEKLK